MIVNKLRMNESLIYGTMLTKAKARRPVYTAKKNAWQSFVYKINQNTPMQNLGIWFAKFKEKMSNN